MNSEQILKILNDELSVIEEIEASVGVAPTAQEALSSVIDKIVLLSLTQELVTE
jgi:hypothetical protein